VTSQRLAVGWALVAIVFVVLLGLELSSWRSLTSEGARAAGERQRLTNEIRLKEQQLVAQMRANAPLLREMQWSSEGGDPSAFLRRLAELAQQKRMRIMAIGPLERQATPQFSKSWHSIQIEAPYRELWELAARVEQERGVVEDVRLEAAPPKQPAQPGAKASAPADEVQARFRVVALELSGQAKQVIDRAIAASGEAGQSNPLTLPVPSQTPPATALARDPFAFVTPPAPTTPATPVTAAGPAAAGERPAPPPLELKGIVSFPGGFLAIVNNQIVKVGDTVSGYRVERITDKSVTVREPGGGSRTVDLPDLASTAAAAPRR
jgi:hypothetical protein